MTRRRPAPIPPSALAYADLASHFDAQGRDLLAHLARAADLPAGDVAAVVAAGADRHVVGAHLFELAETLRRFRAPEESSSDVLAQLVQLKVAWCNLLVTAGRRT